MRYQEFERIVSEERMRRYVEACGGDTRKAMTLYRYNIELSQTMFAIICQFEVALRNAIDKHFTKQLGTDWLRDSIMNDGIFTIYNTHKTFEIINGAYHKLIRNDEYTHTKLLAEMEFGIWKYMFSPVQFRQTGKTLLRIFPQRMKSTKSIQYNHSYIFNELDKINTLRNRIAHHEPICFYLQDAVIYTAHIEIAYQRMVKLLGWMGIEFDAYLFGLDHVKRVCDKINRLTSAKKLNPPA